ncbi:MAG: Nif3-like dinuclear metal center hexameric protein [Prevotella sp.]|nr:Nif3-like dinuclear metal center hexameric protein [Prevotella sp.]
MKIKEVLDALERFAPLPLQEDFDNAGLQVGLTEAEVSGALLCLDVTEKEVDEAIAKGCNLIVSHHPLLFRPLKQITGRNGVQRTVIKAIENRIAIISMHTNLDNARGGVNHKIAEKLGLVEVEQIAKKSVSVLVSALTGEQRQVDGGSGVMGQLDVPMSSTDFIARLKEVFHVSVAQCNALLQRDIRRVAICGGSGGFLLGEAIAAGADAFVTGEMHYHDYFDHDQQIQICVIGHYESEQFTNEILKAVIEEACPSVRCCLSERQSNPVIYI